MNSKLKADIKPSRSNSDSIAPKTPLNKVIQLCGRYKCDHIFVKDESKNPHGTFKDRRNAALLQKHANQDIVIFVHITNGNSGYSLGQQVMASGHSDTSRQVINIIDKKTPKKIKQMLETCSKVVEMDLSKELITDDKLRKIAREVTKYEGPEDNIVIVENYRLKNGYGKIVQEIAEQLDEQGQKPDYIFCPVGGGELASEIAREAEVIWGEDAPKIIGVTVPQNVLVRTKEFIKKVKRSIADKISCGYSKFKELVQNFVNQGRIELTTVKEGEIAKEYRYLNGIHINVEPSAAVAFVGAAKYDLKPDDVVVVINSGKGIYDQKAVDRTWLRHLKKAVVYAAFALMGVTIALGITGSYALHRIDHRRNIEAQAYEHAEKKAKRMDLKKPYEKAEIVCDFLIEQRNHIKITPEKIRKKMCKGIHIWNISDAHIEFFNSHQNYAEMYPDRIIRLMRRDVLWEYRDGHYEDNFSGKWKRFKRWLSSTFNKQKLDDVIKFYYPEYDCLRYSGDYGKCAAFYRIIKLPKLDEEKKEDCRGSYY
jgi:threonine dehydratase